MHFPYLKFFPLSLDLYNEVYKVDDLIKRPK